MTKFTRLLQEQGFEQKKAEACLYTRLIDGQYKYVLVYIVAVS